MKRLVIAVAALSLIVLPGTASAHPGHGSCEGFGQATKGLAQELGGLGGFVTSVPPGAVDDLAAGGHAVFCEQK